MLNELLIIKEISRKEEFFKEILSTSFKNILEI